MATDVIAPFLWGAGGARLTPEEIANQRKMAQTLLASGGDYSPIASPWQGAARVSQALFGGMLGHDAGTASQVNAAESAGLDQQMLGSVGGGAAAAVPAAAPVASPVSAPMGTTSIPAGSVDPSLSGAIKTAATNSGLDPAYLTRLAMVENGGKVNGKSPLSSASGPFQFLDSTAQQYGLTNPSDPAASANAAARFTLDNKAALTQALGREPTMGELYLAHQQGAGGAAKLLANPNAPVESVIGSDAAMNNGATPGMTAGQFAQKWTGKFADIPQTVDPNQKNVIDAQADSPVSPQVAQADPAALPANSTPTQGYAVPGQTQAAPVQSAAPAVTAGRPAINPAILKAMTSPYVDPQTKAVATMLFKSQMDQQVKASDPLRQLQIREAQSKLTPFGDPTTDAQGNLIQRDPLGKVTVLNPADKTPTSVLEYKYYRDNFQPAADKPKPMDYDTWATAKARAAATMINNNVGTGETAFDKEAGKVQANRFNDLVEGGQQAKQMLSDVSTLTDLGKNIGTGKAAQFKAVVGPYADALGVPVKGLSDIQAYEAIVNRVAPTLRVKGSGAQSDFELKNFLKSLPSLGNTPEGNDIAASVLQGLQQNKVLAAEIASKAMNGEITRSEADKQLRNLPDPMIPYRNYMKSSREAPAQTDGWQDLGNGVRIREKK